MTAKALALASAIAVGAVCYVLFVGALWYLARRPQGGERVLLDLLQSRLAARRGAEST